MLQEEGMAESIFDHARDKFLKNKGQSQGSHSEREVREGKRETQKVDDDELREQFKRVWSYVDQVARKLDEAYRLSGMNRKELKMFLSNPQNFASNAFVVLEKERAQIESRLLRQLGQVSGQELKKTEGVYEKGVDKGKTLGARKRWLSM